VSGRYDAFLSGLVSSVGVCAGSFQAVPVFLLGHLRPRVGLLSMERCPMVVVEVCLKAGNVDAFPGGVVYTVVVCTGSSWLFPVHCLGTFEPDVRARALHTKLRTRAPHS
jgi:hypothetical protein